jgi:hypothetical protein
VEKVVFSLRSLPILFQRSKMAKVEYKCGGNTFSELRTAVLQQESMFREQL